MSAHSIADRIARGGIQFVSITEELTRFRKRLETEADKPIHEIDANVAVLLSDLCQFLKLGARQHDAILGDAAVEYITDLLSERIRSTTRH